MLSAWFALPLCDFSFTNFFDQKEKKSLTQVLISQQNLLYSKKKTPTTIKSKAATNLSEQMCKYLNTKMEFYGEFSIYLCTKCLIQKPVVSINHRIQGEKNQILWFIVKFKCPIFHLSTDKHFGAFFLLPQFGVTEWSFIDFFASARQKKYHFYLLFPFHCVRHFQWWSVKWCVLCAVHKQQQKLRGIFTVKSLTVVMW